MEDHKDYPGYIAVIPSDVRYDADLPPLAKLLYGELTALANAKGYCWASNRYFADLYKVTETTIQNHISNLDKRGYIRREVVRDERNAVIGRRIYAGFFVVTPSPKNLGEGSPKNLGESPQKILVENNTSNNNISPIVPSGDGADFDLFWKAYPKKVGKKAAMKAFRRVKVPVETLLQAIERQKCSDQWSRDGGRYIPNPATWLNQGRWEDVLDAQPPDAAAPHGRRKELWT